MVGNVPVGGGAPITVQSMTTTPTHDVEATVTQVKALERAGADIVRVSCPDAASSAALKEIVDQASVPIVADIHFHYKRALEAADNGAACLRINPGNIGSATRVSEVVDSARANGCSMRIGVNAGSLEKELLEHYGEPCPEAMVESALNHARLLADNNFENFKISVKASDVFLCVAFGHHRSWCPAWRHREIIRRLRQSPVGGDWRYDPGLSVSRSRRRGICGF